MDLASEQLTAKGLEEVTDPNLEQACDALMRKLDDKENFNTLDHALGEIIAENAGGIVVQHGLSVFCKWCELFQSAAGRDDCRAVLVHLARKALGRVRLVPTLKVAIEKSTETLVDMVHGYSIQEQEALVGSTGRQFGRHGRHWPQSVAVLRLGMNMDDKFDNKTTEEDENEPLYYWNDLCEMLDVLESNLSEQGVRQFGATMMSKAQVAYIMYPLVGETLKHVEQRLTTKAGLLRTLVEQAGNFILHYGPDRLVEELEAITTAKEMQAAWVLIVPAWIPYPVGWARRRIEDDAKSALFAKKLKLASAWTISDKTIPEDDTPKGIVTFESMDADADGTVTKEEWQTAHGSGQIATEYGLQHSQSQMLTSVQSLMEDELNTLQETDSTPVAEHNKLASLMHLEVRRQKHIRDACALLSRLQEPDDEMNAKSQRTDLWTSRFDHGSPPAHLPTGVGMRPASVELPGTPMWLDDIEYLQVTLQEDEQEEVHVLRHTVSSLNDEHAMNELVVEHTLLPAQAAQELLEVVAGVLVFVKLHHRFIDWKQKMVRRVPKDAWM